MVAGLENDAEAIRKRCPAFFCSHSAIIHIDDVISNGGSVRSDFAKDIFLFTASSRGLRVGILILFLSLVVGFCFSQSNKE